MIIDLKKFIQKERPNWTKLEQVLDRLEKDPEYKMEINEIKQFHYLYQRSSAALAKIMTFSTQADMRHYLETLVARAYSQIHETREKPHKISVFKWFFHNFPQVFRKYIRIFFISLAVMLCGSIFGGAAVSFDPDAKEILMPFHHLRGDPSERVKKEESLEKDRLKGHKANFSSYLMTHNTKVSILTLALGITWGIGTVILLFYNGIILGAVAADYILAGESVFLTGWLLPHGSIEIPAILIAGQAGLVLASAIIGWGKPVTLKTRLRKISADLVFLIFGVGIMLIWAGLVEAFFSQYHAPVIPYEIKIAFGMIQLFMLVFFLGRSGRTVKNQAGSQFD